MISADILVESLIAASRDMREAQERGVDGERFSFEFTEIGVIAILEYASGGIAMRKSCETRWPELLANPGLARHSANAMIRAAGLKN